MFRNAPVCIAVVLCLLFAASEAFAQRAGQSATVRTGTVTAMKSVGLRQGDEADGSNVDSFQGQPGGHGDEHQTERKPRRKRLQRDGGGAPGAKRA